MSSLIIKDIEKKNHRNRPKNKEILEGAQCPPPPPPLGLGDLKIAWAL